MKTPFFIIVNPIIALVISLLCYFALSNIYDADLQETATIHIGILLFFIFVMPCYLLTMLFFHFQKKRLAVYSFVVHIFIVFSAAYYLISTQFLSIHLPIEIVKYLIISFVLVGAISLYFIFGVYYKLLSK
ncbi:hypothetical protein P9B03_12330 [Metasolibacillus meyeri]|uniref:Uncharacterized protein n=1 Tax=Metasolibacillus meyeri TaxID=1071052 RepID=A0AAW9NX37_9BACL|nr:hypothetical protein [Metasolibacillus meyeri]MEC1179275.1 hypothetical protein [Metasolibacillus meyeri]